MNRGSRLIIDLLRLLSLIILLPLILLVAGPLLVIAALAGRISLGALQLRPGKYRRGGRIWAFSLGIIIWSLIWGGLAWAWNNPTVVTPSKPTQPATAQVVLLTATQTRIPATSTPSETATATSQLLTATRLPTATPTNIPPTPLSPPATPTATRVVSPPTATPTIPLTPSPSLQQDALTQTLAEANNALIQYLQRPNSDNQILLETFWTDEALREVQTFAQKINTRYQRPLTITYTTITQPIITPIDNTSVAVQSREFWIYQDRTGNRESLSDYNYIFQAQDDGWVIVRYQFKILPAPPNAAPATTAEVITSTSTGP